MDLRQKFAMAIGLREVALLEAETREQAAQAEIARLKAEVAKLSPKLVEPNGEARPS